MRAFQTNGTILTTAKNRVKYTTLRYYILEGVIDLKSNYNTNSSCLKLHQKSVTMVTT